MPASSGVLQDEGSRIAENIAVIGMSINVAGADNIEHFWNLINNDAPSRVEIPNDRIQFETAYRQAEPDRQWHAALLADHDAFDHKFFKKTPREAASLDPQQRLLLQCSYQAMQQSGHFNRVSQPKDVGVFVGMSATDYDSNIASHAPNAFSATGNLRGFIAGRVSHFFGWEGPALTIDTGDSSSAVAVHRACRAILDGECSAAVAGGASLLLSASRFQDLAASIPPSSDRDAPYLGEAMAVIILKSFSKAVQDGDPIVGCITASSVMHNPSNLLPDLKFLRDQVLAMGARSGVSLNEVAIVDSIGPATFPAGSLEVGGIFDHNDSSSNSPRPIAKTSLREWIGHTEAASGVVSVIAMILMIHEGSIPKQLSSVSIDMISAGLILNSSTSGSVATLLITKAPPRKHAPSLTADRRQPVCIFGNDEASLRQYSTVLAKYLGAHRTATLPTLALNICRQSNPTLPKSFIFAVNSTSEIVEQLHGFSRREKNLVSTSMNAKRAVILCFGEPSSRVIGLCRDLYKSISLLRQHLDECDATLRSIGFGGIFPQLFDKDHIANLAGFQICLFSLQYAVAQCWTRSLTHISGIVGHPFGSMAFLIIDGVITLREALTEIMAQGSKADTAWDEGSDTTMAVDTDHVQGSSGRRHSLYLDDSYLQAHQDHSDAVWLDAGFGSPTIHAAQTAESPSKQCFYQTVELCSDNSMYSLADTFTTLWGQGVPAVYWPHHMASNELVFLPPYQFDKSRHWLRFKSFSASFAQPQPTEPSTGLFTHIGEQNTSQRNVELRVNTASQDFEHLVQMYTVARTAPVYSTTTILNVVIEALLLLQPVIKAEGLQLQMGATDVLTPLTMRAEKDLRLSLNAMGEGIQEWSWQIASNSRREGIDVIHMRGQLVFKAKDAQDVHGSLRRFGNLVSYQRCREILESSNPASKVRGRYLYQMTSDCLEYDEKHRLLQVLVGTRSAAVGRFSYEGIGEHWMNGLSFECPIQVSSLWANGMTGCPAADMFLMKGFEHWSFKSLTTDLGGLPGIHARRKWDVLAVHGTESERTIKTDIFIFDVSKEVLQGVILGVRHERVEKATILTTLLGTSSGAGEPEQKADRVSTQPYSSSQSAARSPDRTMSPPVQSTPLTRAQHADDIRLQKEQLEHNSLAKPELMQVISGIVADLVGIKVDTVNPGTLLADIGIDSLLGMELLRELEAAFTCKLGANALANAMDITDIATCVQEATGSGGFVSRHPEPQARTIEPLKEQLSESPVRTSTPHDHMHDLQLSSSIALEAFNESKALTDNFIQDAQCQDYLLRVCPEQTQLCLSLTLEAFGRLGCSIVQTEPGDEIGNIPHDSKHSRFVEYLYNMIEKETGLIRLHDDGRITRNHEAASIDPSRQIHERLMTTAPDHQIAHRLVYYCGSRLANVLSGQLDGVRLLFSDLEGRQLISGLYGDTRLNQISYRVVHMFLQRLLAQLPQSSAPLKILEVGAGTGGLTKVLIPLLRKLGKAVEYTYTDLGPSFVATARRSFAADSAFMKFRAHDIEQPAPADLRGTQHLVLASNAVHATRDLHTSLTHLRGFLRADGLLLMVEMTEPLRWVDMIFGVLEGWWIFQDERQHALVDQWWWQRELQRAGYGRVDWSDGRLPENRIQRVIMAMASAG